MDGTLGGGGHAEKLLINLSKKARYIGIDQDKEAIEFAKQRLNTYKNITYHQGNFVDLDRSTHIEKYDKIYRSA